MSLPHVELKQPDTALAAVPMQPAPVQNLPDAQASGLLPKPDSPVASGDLSTLAAISARAPSAQPPLNPNGLPPSPK